MTSPLPPEAPPVWANEPYSIKRYGVTVTNCDTEPIRTPGCIQSHGALLVLRPSDLSVLQASEHCEHLLGRPPEALLGQPVTTIFGAERVAMLAGVVAGGRVENNPLYVFSIPSLAGGEPLDVSIHTTSGVAVLEIEATGRESTGTDYCARVKEVIAHLFDATDVRDFCRIAAAEIHALTGLDRVMIYRFHADWHGEVVAESKREDLPPWLGLHYPADDIPSPVREIWRHIWIRPLSDAAAPVLELCPLVNAETGRPLDMTYCALRGASVMYTEYLANMRVAASLTMPIRRDGQLWGLVACHHATPAHFPWQLRAACELLGQVLSMQLGAAEEREAFARRAELDEVHRRLVAAAAQRDSLGVMTEGSPDITFGMEASGAAIFHGDRWWRAGRTPVASSSSRWRRGSRSARSSSRHLGLSTPRTRWFATTPRRRRTRTSRAASSPCRSRALAAT